MSTQAAFPRVVTDGAGVTGEAHRPVRALTAPTPLGELRAPDRTAAT